MVEGSADWFYFNRSGLLSTCVSSVLDRRWKDRGCGYRRTS